MFGDNRRHAHFPRTEDAGRWGMPGKPLHLRHLGKEPGNGIGTSPGSLRSMLGNERGAIIIPTNVIRLFLGTKLPKSSVTKSALGASLLDLLLRTGKYAFTSESEFGLKSAGDVLKNGFLDTLKDAWHILGWIGNQTTPYVDRTQSDSADWNFWLMFAAIFLVLKRDKVAGWFGKVKKTVQDDNQMRTDINDLRKKIASAAAEITAAGGNASEAIAKARKVGITDAKIVEKLGAVLKGLEEQKKALGIAAQTAPAPAQAPTQPAPTQAPAAEDANALRREIYGAVGEACAAGRSTAEALRGLAELGGRSDADAIKILRQILEGLKPQTGGSA